MSLGAAVAPGVSCGFCVVVGEPSLTPPSLLSEAPAEVGAGCDARANARLPSTPLNRWTEWARDQVGHWPATDDPGRWDTRAALDAVVTDSQAATAGAPGGVSS